MHNACVASPTGLITSAFTSASIKRSPLQVRALFGRYLLSGRLYL
jgi:hypothetical protein